MSRPLKQGLDYFPYDIDLDQDDKLGMIIGEFGDKGERLYTKMLCWIYKHEGYYTSWNEDVQLRFLRRYNYCGFSMSFMEEAVPRFVKWGLFDKTVFDKVHILTSARIQKTWIDASRKRKDRIIIKKVWLLSVNDGIKLEETELTAEETTQKESKVNKIKKKKIPPAPAACVEVDKNEFIIRIFGEKFIPEWEKWKNYKRKEFKFLFKSEESEQAAFTELVNLSGKKFDRAVAIINQSLAKGWKGFFDLDQESRKTESVQVSDTKQRLSKLQVEVNYLFERFLEDESHVTIISAESEHYDLLKNAGLIEFTAKEFSDISAKAKKELNGTADEKKLLQMKKKYGVIQFFKQQKAIGNVTIFRMD
jgi:hypothetical protein